MMIAYLFEWIIRWLVHALQCTGLYRKSAKVLFLGLDNAGKTTLLGRLESGKIRTHCPTFKPRGEQLSVGGIVMKTIDLGGYTRELWPEYFFDVHGVVFVVDASDPDRFEEAREELHKLLQNKDLKNATFLVLGNKIDNHRAVHEDQLKAALGLAGRTTGKTTTMPKKATGRPVELVMCSVWKKIGYSNGLQWLARQLWERIE